MFIICIIIFISINIYFPQNLIPPFLIIFSQNLNIDLADLLLAQPSCVIETQFHQKALTTKG